MLKVHLSALDNRSQPSKLITVVVTVSVIKKLEKALGCNINVGQIKNMRIIK